MEITNLLSNRLIEGIVLNKFKNDLKKNGYINPQKKLNNALKC